MREELLNVAGKVVEAGKNKGVQCEAFVQKKRYSSITVEGGKVTFGAQDGDYGIGIRVIKDKRAGFSYCTERSIDYGIDQAIAVMRFSKPGNYEFHKNTKYSGTRTIFDNRIATLIPEDGLRMAGDIIESASFDKRALASRGGLSFGVAAFAVANTNNVSVYDEGTFIGGHMMTVLKEGDMIANGDESLVSRSLDIDMEEIGRTSTEKAISQLDQKAVETKKMAVILKPEAAFDLLSNTVMPALYGGAVKKNESVYVDKLGKKVASENITIVDDGTHPKGLNTFIMDEEGYPSQRNVLIENGILKKFLYDEFTANEYDEKATGSAMHWDRFESGTTYKVPPSTCARNFMPEGETMPENEMIKDIKEGIIVENVLGAHTSNKASGDFSVAIYSGYAIKHGEIAFPLKGGMLGGNMPGMLMKAVLADNYKIVESGPTCGYIPSMMFEDVSVSGE